MVRILLEQHRFSDFYSSWTGQWPSAQLDDLYFGPGSIQERAHIAGSGFPWLLLLRIICPLCQAFAFPCEHVEADLAAESGCGWSFGSFLDLQLTS
jgi:hypothetical protein